MAVLCLSGGVCVPEMAFDYYHYTDNSYYIPFDISLSIWNPLIFVLNIYHRSLCTNTSQSFLGLNIHISCWFNNQLCWLGTVSLGNQNQIIFFYLFLWNGFILDWIDWYDALLLFSRQYVPIVLDSHTQWMNFLCIVQYAIKMVGRVFIAYMKS